MDYQKNKKKQEQKTVLEVLILGVFKSIGYIFKLIFGRGKGGSGISAEDKSYILNKKHEIWRYLDSESVIEVKHAVMEADKLVDFLLQKRGYAGATFADRLKSAEKYIDRNRYENLWQGHKTRNMIAHDSSEISIFELKNAVKKLLSYVEA